MSFPMTVENYGTFQVNKRSADVELMIAMERDRLLIEYLRRNNALNPSSPPLKIDDLSESTTSFYSYFATFSQTVVTPPADFDTQAFMQDWSRAKWNDFLGAYLKALVELEESFRESVENTAEPTDMEQHRATRGKRMASPASGE